MTVIGIDTGKGGIMFAGIVTILQHSFGSNAGVGNEPLIPIPSGNDGTFGIGGAMQGISQPPQWSEAWGARRGYHSLQAWSPMSLRDLG